MLTASQAPDAAARPAPSWRRLQTLRRLLATPACLLAIVVFAVAFHRNVLTGSAHYWLDITGYNYPLLYFEGHSLIHGSFALWDGHNYSGLPLVANPQSAQFYPPHLLLFAQRILAGKDVSEFQVQLLDFSHFVIGGLGMFALLRTLSAARLYALMGSLAWMASGFLLAQTQHLGVIETMAWAPLMLALALRLAWRPGAGAALLFMACTAMAVLAGFLPQAAVLVVFCLAVFAAEMVRTRPAHWRRSLVHLGAGLAGAGALTAVALLPILSYLHDSIPLNAHGGLAPQSLLTVLMPNYYRNDNLAAYWGPGDFTTTYFYMGLPVLLLAAVGLVVTRGAATTFKLLLALSVLLSFSPMADAVLRVVHGVPFEGNLLRPEDFAPVVGLAVVVLAVLGLNDLRRSRWVALAAAATAAAVLVVAKLTPRLAGHSVRDLAVAATILMVAVAAIALIPRGGWKPVLALLCAGELFFANSGRLVVATPGTDYQVGPSAAERDTAVIPELRTLAQGYRVSVDQEVSSGSWWTGWRVWGIDSVNGFEPQLSQHYFDTVLANGATWHTDRLFDFSSYAGRLPELLNIGYVVTQRQGGLHDPRLTAVWQHGAYTIYRMADARQRYLVFNPDTFHCTGNDCSIDSSLGAGTPARLASSDPNTRTVTVHATAPGSLLFASEAWYPGWQAEVDGTAAPVVKVDDLVMGVVVPRGAHSVHLEFRPASFTAGLAVTALASAAWLLAWPALALRSRRRTIG